MNRDTTRSIASEITDERGPMLHLRHIMPAWLGRLCTVIFNTTMSRVPFAIKYGLGSWLRRSRAPYRFLQPSDVVVQIGSARDILLSGRSRAVFLSLFLPQGRLIVIEADIKNQDALERYIQRHKLDNITLVRSGAWDKATQLEFWSNPNHPASNLVREANQVIHKPVDESKYIKHKIEVDSVDNILSGLGVGVPTMVCVTTNGSEPYILQGMSKTIAAGCRYLSLAPTGRQYVEKAQKLGFRYLAKDDRGYFFEREEPSK